MITIKKNISDNSIENRYAKSTPIEHRKKFAQFFTPFPIANLMAKWVLGNANLKNVLEPAFGLGVFSRALLSQNENIEITGFDVDESILESANTYFGDVKNVHIHLQDYMYNDWENKYDGSFKNFFIYFEAFNIEILFMRE